VELLLKISKQALWQLSGKAVTVASTFIVLGVISRSYGQDGLGVYTLATAYLAFFYIAADLGLNNYILPRYQEDKKEINNIYNFRVYWAIILIIFANLLALILPLGNIQFNIAVLIGSFTILTTNIFSTSNIVFQNRLSYDKVAISSALGVLSMIPTIFVVTYFNLQTSMLLSSVLISGIITVSLSLYFVKKKVRISIKKPDISYPLNIMREAWPLSLTLIFNILYFRVDAFLITTLRSFSEVGVYNLAYQVFQNALVLPTFVMNAYYPIMLRVMKNDVYSYLKYLKILLVIMLSISIVGIILVQLLAPFIINLLTGGGFDGSITSLKILSLSFPAYFLSSVFMWVFLSYKKYVSLLIIYLSGMLINFLLNVYFIPEYSYIAASVITGVSEYLILILQMIILYKVLKAK
jgi:O-antigen/teichoic acid export membrane protein